MSSAEELLAGLKLMKEPECWCGPDSVAKEPEPFREVPEGHFQLTTAQADELNQIYQQRRSDPHNLPQEGTSGFVLKGGSAEFERKRHQLLESLDHGIRSLYNDPQSPLKATVSELLRVNNIQEYDLSGVEYNQSDALKGFEELNKRFESEKRTVTTVSRAVDDQMKVELPNETSGNHCHDQDNDHSSSVSGQTQKPKFVARNSRMVEESTEKDTVKLVKPARSFASKMAKFQYQPTQEEEERGSPSFGMDMEPVNHTGNHSSSTKQSEFDDDLELAAGFKKKPS